MLAIKNERPDEDVLADYEDEFTAAVAAALQKVARGHLRGITADTANDITQRVSNLQTWQPLTDVLAAELAKIAEAGAVAGRLVVEREALGVRKDFFGIDWDLANNAAVQWARRYAGELIREVQDTTLGRVRVLVSDWINNGEPIAALRERILSSTDYGYNRARTIAVTETTRAYAEGNLASWRESGVIERKRWNTANDELVCPICGPLHRQVVDLDATWDGIEKPPAHPNCRCWVTPVIITQTDAEAEIELIESMGYDPFEAIRPPAGRAPRGRGEEYRARRRIVSRIQTQMKWRATARRNLERYRGQSGQSWEVTEMRERLAQLDKAIESMIEVASQPQGDWTFKMELVDGIIEYVQAYTTQKAIDAMMLRRLYERIMIHDKSRENQVSD